MKKALQLNNGKYVNTCVYFISEIRQNGVDILNVTCNTTELIAQLNVKGWTRSLDYKNPCPGDICFIADKNNGNNAPSHIYVFMAWLSRDNYNYAMVCDNQANRYESIYHKRNIVKSRYITGIKKEEFSYFIWLLFSFYLNYWF